LLKLRSETVVLDHVTKVTAGADPQLIFASVTAALPVNRRMAVLGRQGAGKSTLLGMLGGTEPVDGGRVRGKPKFSMVLNGKGFLYTPMSGIENAEMLARMFALPPKRFVELAMSLPGVPAEAWVRPVGEMLPRARRALEILLAALLPFECYLLDDVERVEQNAVAALIRLTSPRGAGLIFCTFNAKFARQYATCAAVIANRKLAVFDTVKEAEAHYG